MTAFDSSQLIAMLLLQSLDFICELLFKSSVPLFLTFKLILQRLKVLSLLLLQILTLVVVN